MKKASMYSRFRLAQKYLRYYFAASNGKGHGIHSPFVFDFIQHVLNDDRDFPAYSQIEGLRRRLLNDRTLLEIEDMGAGGKPHRTIADIARHAAKPKKLGQLLFRIAHHYCPQKMLELGSSLGLSAAYLASGALGRTSTGTMPGTTREAATPKLITIEGSPSIATVAAANFKSLGLVNIEIETGNFDDLLDGALDKLGNADLAFIDGNHRREPTLRYFESLMSRSYRPSVLIFDDIHWSAEMEEAWAKIRAEPRSMLTIDLFFLGLVFLRDEFKVKQDFTIRF
jgi:predicted O-methyltransferase YrrM